MFLVAPLIPFFLPWVVIELSPDLHFWRLSGSLLGTATCKISIRQQLHVFPSSLFYKVPLSTFIHHSPGLLGLPCPPGIPWSSFLICKRRHVSLTITLQPYIFRILHTTWPLPKLPPVFLRCTYVNKHTFLLMLFSPCFLSQYSGYIEIKIKSDLSKMKQMSPKRLIPK